MTAAVKAAGEANALVVASAGNDGRDIASHPNYPAAIPARNLVAVAATDPASGRGISNFSNYGRLAVQVAAPGADILSTGHDGGWEVKSGTSMAAPMVSGVAALAASVNPRISAVDLRAVLMQNATRSRLPVAAGYVDALRSVLAASHAAGYDTTQPPRLQILTATRKGKRTKIQAAVLGSTAAIRRYRITLGGKTVQLKGHPASFTVNLRRRGPRVKIAALDASGRVIDQGAAQGDEAAQGQAGRRHGRRRPDMNRRAVAALGTALLAAGVAAGPQASAAAPKPIRMSGQQITQVLVADLGYFYRHERPRAPRFDLSVGGTDAGIADTVRGISDAALVSRDLEPGDPRGLVLTRLARSGVCLVSHRSNPVPSINRALLQDIVAGRVTNWSQVPGSPRTDPIVPIALDPGVGAAHVFEQVFIDDDTPFAWRPITLLLGLQVRDLGGADPGRVRLPRLRAGPLRSMPSLPGRPLHPRGNPRRELPGHPADRDRHRRPSEGGAPPVPALGADQPHRAPRDRHALRADRPRPLSTAHGTVAVR